MAIPLRGPFCGRCALRIPVAGRLLLLAAFVLMSACSQGEDVPEGATAIDEFTEVGDCLGPDPKNAELFIPRDCDDPQATVSLIATDSAIIPAQSECPVGTDALVEARQGLVSDNEIVGLPEVWCLRNIAPPHPGDAGMGGGQLLAGDCFDIGGSGDIAEVPCDSGGAAGGEYRLLEPVEGAASDCPPGTTDPIELSAAFPPQVLCATTR